MTMKLSDIRNVNSMHEYLSDVKQKIQQIPPAGGKVHLILSDGSHATFDMTQTLYIEFINQINSETATYYNKLKELGVDPDA